LLGSVEVSSTAKAIAENLHEAKDTVVFLGNYAVQSPGYSTLRALSSVIAENTASKLGYLGEAANTAGAWLAGLIPHRKEAGGSLDASGMNAGDMISHPKKVYVLLDVEVEHDSDNPQQARAAMDQSDCVVVIAPYASASLLEYADIILPSAAYSETSGTFVNVEGTWQSFQASAKSFGEARPAWKIFRVLGNMLDVKGFDYVSSADVKEELKLICESVADVDNSFEVSGIYTNLDPVAGDNFHRVGEVGEFSGDSLVRRATALQKSQPEQKNIQLNSNEIKRLDTAGVLEGDSKIVNVKQGDLSVAMSLVVNEMVPDKCAFLAAGTETSSLFGSAFGEIEVTI
jgi:NADH-quinone oxidoreductase subunit G